MSKEPFLYVGHILTCIHSILEYTKGMNEESFLNNKLV